MADNMVKRIEPNIQPLTPVFTEGDEEGPYPSIMSLVHAHYLSTYPIHSRRMAYTHKRCLPNQKNSAFFDEFFEAVDLADLEACTVSQLVLVHLIAGIRGDNLRNRILRSKDIDRRAIKEMIDAHERAETDNARMQAPLASDPSHASVNATRQSTAQRAPRPASSASSSRNAGQPPATGSTSIRIGTAERKSGICYRCGDTSHTSQGCKKNPKKLRCSKCRRKGHEAAACLSSAKARQTAATSNADEYIDGQGELLAIEHAPTDSPAEARATRTTASNPWNCPVPKVDL